MVKKQTNKQSNKQNKNKTVVQILFKECMEQLPMSASATVTLKGLNVKLTAKNDVSTGYFMLLKNFMNIEKKTSRRSCHL